MHPRTLELLRHLDDHRAAVLAAASSVPAALRARQPAPGRWSVAEVIEHLALVEHQVSVLLARGLRTATSAGPLPRDADETSVLARIDAAALLDRERSFTAPPAARPSRNLDADAALHALADSRAAVRATMLASDGLDTRGIRARHPFLGELDFLQWLAFVGYHEARHAAQIRAIHALLVPD